MTTPWAVFRVANASPVGAVHCRPSGDRRLLLALQGGCDPWSCQAGVDAARHETGMTPGRVIGSTIDALAAAPTMA